MVAPAQPGDSIETLYVDIAARADQLIRDAEVAVQAVVQKLDEIERKTQETSSAFGRLGNFIKESFAIATGISLANVGLRLGQAIRSFGSALIQTNAQMQQYEQSFTVLTGSAEAAGEIIEWVKEQAKETPFDVEGLIEASQMLMTWGLDIKEWFTVVGDTAAAVNKPLAQVVNAIGTLASGQTGEAVRRFRDLGINLRDYEQFQFDAQGALVTPLEQAIPMVRQILIDRFGGMMEAQSQTWNGVMSNMRDTWTEVVRLMGEPIFDTLNEALQDLQRWIRENEEGIEEFASNLGSALGATLDILMGILGGFSDLVNFIDDIIGRILGVPDWVQEGIYRGRQVAGIGAGMIRAGVHVAGGLAAGESWEEAAYGAAAAWRETMLNVAGWSEEATDSLTADSQEAQQAMDDLAAKWRDVFRGMTDEAARAELERMVARGLDAMVLQQTLDQLVEAGVLSAQVAERYREETAAVQILAEEYTGLVQKYEDIARAEALAAENAERLRAAQEANLQLAQEVADKLGDRLADAIERYQEAIEEATRATEEAIAEIEAEAARAEMEAVERHQQEVDKLRQDFAREQIRRRRQFNLEWARLIREQNQEVLDAEWEYEFAKKNLLLEGDEIALAELEARYEHEKDVRSREQQDARDDLAQRFDEENARRQEQFDLQMRELETRLQRELESIREQAREEVKAKQEALEERLENEEDALNERLRKIGELLRDEIGDNQYATAIILRAWADLYNQEVALAIQAGMTARAELDSIMQAAIRAAAAVENVGVGGRWGYYGRYPRSGRQAGGYSPPGRAVIESHPGEWMASAATTRALEQATGGPLTQQNVRALSRRVLDVNVNAVGVPADMVRRMYRDLIDALRDESEF